MAKVLLALVATVAGIGCLAWPLLAYLSVFMFDAPGSLESQITGVLALSLVLYPIPAILGNIYFWYSFSRDRVRGYFFGCLVSVSGYAAIALSFAALEIFCGGNFVCGSVTE